MVDPTMYRKQAVEFKNGKSILYLKLQKYLYGYIREIIPFYEKIYTYLQEMGFVINPQDSCFTKDITNGRQFNMVWHVDNLDMYHIYIRSVTNFIEELEMMYGDVREAWGKIND